MSQSHEALILIQKMVKVPPPKALLLFNTATYQGLHHTPHSISFILNLLLSSDMLLQAQSLILRLISGRIPSSMISPSSLMLQLIQPPFHLLSNCFDIAWWVFNEFKRKVVMDAYSFGIMIKGRCEAGDLMKGFRLLAMLEEFGFSLNVVIYTTLIYGCCKSGDVRLAKKLFCTMDRLGLVANHHSCGGLCRGKKFGEAVKIVHQVNKVGLSPNIVTYNILINGFCDVGKIDTAVRLFNQLKSNGLSPTLVTYNTLIAGYSKVENLAGALDLVKEMEERCIPPSKVTYNSN
ncbi:hypothetical protein JHK82_019861 [Glycine max]|nr:hypothetical protein JHK82_019861 [Glycine max]